MFKINSSVLIKLIDGVVCDRDNDKIRIKCDFKELQLIMFHEAYNSLSGVRYEFMNPTVTDSIMDLSVSRKALMRILKDNINTTIKLSTRSDNLMILFYGNPCVYTDCTDVVTIPCLGNEDYSEQISKYKHGYEQFNLSGNILIDISMFFKRTFNGGKSYIHKFSITPKAGDLYYSITNAVTVMQIKERYGINTFGFSMTDRSHNGKRLLLLMRFLGNKRFLHKNIALKKHYEDNISEFACMVDDYTKFFYTTRSHAEDTMNTFTIDEVVALFKTEVVTSCSNNTDIKKAMLKVLRDCKTKTIKIQTHNNALSMIDELGSGSFIGHLKNTRTQTFKFDTLKLKNVLLQMTGGCLIWIPDGRGQCLGFNDHKCKVFIAPIL